MLRVFLVKDVSKAIEMPNLIDTLKDILDVVLLPMNTERL